MSPKPMLTEDHLIRQINLAIAALARILGLKAAGQYQAALFEIDQLLEELIGLRSYMIKNLAEDGILAIVSTPDGLNTDRLLIIAELIKHEGDIYADKNYRSESISSYLRALKFYLEVQLSGGPVNLPPPHDQIRELLEQLKPSELPAETLYNLFDYYEQVGEFAQSEAMLAELLNATGLREQLLQEFESFYTRLLEKSDQELLAGGLSRSEVRQKLGRLDQLLDNR